MKKIRRKESPGAQRRPENVFRLVNGITLSRVLGAALLVFTSPFSPGFFVLYLFCGVTDVLDGWLARHFHAESEGGAFLDSMADFVFMAAALFVIIPSLSPERWALWWAAGIGGVRLISLLASRLRFGCFAWLHTAANKATGLLLFACPLALGGAVLRPALLLVGTAASISALEELAILLTQPRLNRDQMFFFTPKKSAPLPRATAKTKDPQRGQRLF